MTPKPLLFAIMAILPITANAEYTYNWVNVPGGVPENGTVTRSGTPIFVGGGYQTAQITNDDKNHIASTAYVKGAYNDAIAVLNVKQNALVNSTTEDEMGAGVVGTDDFLNGITGGDDYVNAENNLVSAAAVAAGIQSQRVEVYTNWDDDDATTDVAFKTVVPE